MITAVEESDGQDSSVVRRPIVIVSINDTIGAATVRGPLKRHGLERKSGAAGNRTHIYIYICIHHHRIKYMQPTTTTTPHSASCNLCIFVYVHISKCSKEKCHQHKLQWTMTTMTASRVFALVDGWKNTTSSIKLHNVKTILGSGMQQPNAGSTRARSALRWCPCASCIWLLQS